MQAPLRSGRAASGGALRRARPLRRRASRSVRSAPSLKSQRNHDLPPRRACQQIPNVSAYSGPRRISPEPDRSHWPGVEPLLPAVGRAVRASPPCRTGHGALECPSGRARPACYLRPRGSPSDAARMVTLGVRQVRFKDWHSSYDHVLSGRSSTCFRSHPQDSGRTAPTHEPASTACRLTRRGLSLPVAGRTTGGPASGGHGTRPPCV